MVVEMAATDPLPVEPKPDTNVSRFTRHLAILSRIGRHLGQPPEPGLADHIGFAPLAEMLEGRLD